ncbi:MAG: hypothetical protein HY505_00040 [Candidatus Yanofskybacteria bacterium]|nr:hypothetical protein [Candidatus Yanofskybacteria bacterium]
MDSKETVRKLVVGSDAIDRMRREINSVVKTVLGLIQQECDSTSWIDVTGQIFHPEVLITLSYPYIKGACGWSVTGWTSSRGHKTPGWMAQCSLSDPFNLGSQIYCSNESYTISLQNVKTVHDNLGVFVEKMIKKFPFLTERLQPLLDAAVHTKKSGWQL